MSANTRRWPRWRNRRHCPHRRLLAIYGDMINHVGGYRLQCLNCWAYLDGPVSLAKERQP